MNLSDLKIIEIPVLGYPTIKIAALNVESLDVEGWLYDSEHSISSYRKVHALRYVQEIDRQRSLGATLLVDHLLHQYNLNEAEMEYAKNEYGKPYFKHYPQLHFNLSHSGKYAIAAFDAHPIGIDIQQLTPFQEEIAARCMKPLEIEALKAQPVAQRDLLFTSCWCLKEAIVKEKGTGIEDDFPVTLIEQGQPTWHDESNPNLSYRIVQLDDCMVAVVFHKK